MSNGESEHPGVKCRRCGETIPVFSGTTDRSQLEKLPNPFPLKCLTCGDESTYPKSAIVPGRSVEP